MLVREKAAMLGKITQQCCKTQSEDIRRLACDAFAFSPCSELESA